MSRKTKTTGPVTLTGCREWLGQVIGLIWPHPIPPAKMGRVDVDKYWAGKQFVSPAGH